MIKLAVFLGNPGAGRAFNRHNLGQIVAEALHSGPWQKKFDGLWARSGSLVLLKPGTYMNDSGLPARKASDYFRIRSDETAVCHDDASLPFGEVRLEFGGPLRGHNGLRSVASHLGTTEFWRLRLGIGRPMERQPLASYVLGNFSPGEKALLDGIAAEARRLLLENGGANC